MTVRSFPARELLPAADRGNRRAQRMAKPALPIKKRHDNGGERFAPFDLREVLALASLGARQGAAWAVLGWMKILATTDDRGDYTEVEVADLALCQRTGLSWNTIARAIKDLSSIGLFSSMTRRRGAKGRYRLAFGPRFDVGKPARSSPEIGEHGEGVETPESSEIGERFPRFRGTAPQKLGTRSDNSEQGTEKSALRPAQQARSSVNHGSSPAGVSEIGCEVCLDEEKGFRPGWVKSAGGAARCQCNPGKRKAAGEGS